MPEPLVIVVIVLIVAAIAAGAWYAWKLERDRREALGLLAAELGWRFEPARDWSHDREYANFEIFRRGHSRCAYNTLTGTVEIDDRPCYAKAGDFTYKITTGSGKSRRTHTYHFSYLIVHLPFARAVPDLLIRPETVLDKIAGAFGFTDINFESAEFSRRFFVKCADRKFAYDVIHPRMMEFLLATKPPIIDLEHGRLCLSNGRQRWTPQEFRGWLKWTVDFFDQWPDYLHADLRQGVRTPA